MNAELTQRFGEVIASDDPALDMVSLIIGAHDDPSIDVDAELIRLDTIAGKVPAPVTLENLLVTVFGVYGYHGDVQTYDDPRNSFLHEVLRRRQGMPITLSVLLIEVGRRVGISLQGVGAPGHFLTKVAGTDIYVDAFGGGRVIEAADIEATVARRAPGYDVAEVLAPVGAVPIAERILANLVNSYGRRSDRHALHWVCELQTLLPTARPEHHHAYALSLAAVGKFADAADRLDALVESGTLADPAKAKAKATATRLRARLN